jgi:serine/threonine-protein kinase
MTEWHQELEAALAGSYVIERELGRGGSATVFLAHDRKHDRRVAIKVLLPEIAPAVSVERFLREIQIAARLMHPHIVPLIDSGRAGDLPYYVMPFVPGESLRERLLRDQRLPVDDAIRIAREVADALNYAHAVGVVHRDIKPENILMASGHAVVADFGIGKAMSASTGPHRASGAHDQPARSHFTDAGFVLGTPAYMSLEQAAGDDMLDGRTDIYSLGVVLYEMLTGAPPFSGPSAQVTLARRFVEDAPPLRRLRPEASETTEAAVQRALMRDPADRFATAGEFGAALAAGAVTSAQPKAAADDAPSIAVLPFANMSADPDNEFFSDGMTEEIINALTRLRRLRVVARTSVFAFKGKAEDVRAIGGRLGVRTILEGSVRRAGGRLRITAQLINVADGYRLWFEQFDRESGDVFAIQDEIAQAIAKTLELSLFGGGVVERAGGDPAAYELFLRARHMANRRTETSLHKAIDYYRSARERDTDYALAYSGEAEAWGLLAVYGAVAPAEAMPKAKEAARRAIALDPSRAEPHAALGMVRAAYDWDRPGAIAEFERAVQIDPQYPAGTQWLSTFVLTPAGRHEESLAAIRRCLLLDPLSPVLHMSLSGSLFYARRWADALAAADAALEVAPDFPLTHSFRGQSLSELGRHDEAVAALERAVQHSDRSPETVAALACVLARAGDAERARAEFARMVDSGRTRYVSLTLVAQVQSALDDKEQAFRALGRAVEERASDLIWIGVRPNFDPLRGDPRFRAALERVGLSA